MNTFQRKRRGKQFRDIRPTPLSTRPGLDGAKDDIFGVMKDYSNGFGSNFNSASGGAYSLGGLTSQTGQNSNENLGPAISRDREFSPTQIAMHSGDVIGHAGRAPKALENAEFQSAIYEEPLPLPNPEDAPDCETLQEEIDDLKDYLSLPVKISRGVADAINDLPITAEEVAEIAGLLGGDETTSADVKAVESALESLADAYEESGDTETADEIDQLAADLPALAKTLHEFKTKKSNEYDTSIELQKKQNLFDAWCKEFG